MERLETNVVLLEQALVTAETVKQLTLGESAASLAVGYVGRRYALGLGSDAVGTREFVIALHFTLLAQHVCKHPLRLCAFRGWQAHDTWRQDSGILL